MTFTIRSLIVPTFRVGGRGDEPAWIMAAATAAARANAFMGRESTRSALISEPTEDQ